MVAQEILRDLAPPEALAEEGIMWIGDLVHEDAV
jgi:hypothetical protein